MKTSLVVAWLPAAFICGIIGMWILASSKRATTGFLLGVTLGPLGIIAAAFKRSPELSKRAVAVLPESPSHSAPSTKS